MPIFRKQDIYHSKRAGGNDLLSGFSAFALSIALHGAVFALAFLTIGNWGRSGMTLPEIQPVIEVDIVEAAVPPKVEKNVPQKPKIIKPVTASPKPVQALKTEQSQSAPRAGQKAGVARGGFSRESYVQKLTGHITAHKYYPKRARQRRAEGKVIVSFSIDRQGRLSNARVVKSSRSHLLDHAALTTLKRAQPFPLPDGGAKQGNMTFKIPINYSLKR